MIFLRSNNLTFHSIVYQLDKKFNLLTILYGLCSKDERNTCQPDILEETRVILAELTLKSNTSRRRCSRIPICISHLLWLVSLTDRDWLHPWNIIQRLLQRTTTWLYDYFSMKFSRKLFFTLPRWLTIFCIILINCTEGSRRTCKNPRWINQYSCNQQCGFLLKNGIFVYIYIYI